MFSRIKKVSTAVSSTMDAARPTIELMCEANYKRDLELAKDVAEMYSSPRFYVGWTISNVYQLWLLWYFHRKGLSKTATWFASVGMGSAMMGALCGQERILTIKRQNRYHFESFKLWLKERKGADTEEWGFESDAPSFEELAEFLTGDHTEWLIGGPGTPGHQESLKSIEDLLAKRDQGEHYSTLDDLLNGEEDR
jgi:hypothetical protein